MWPYDETEADWLARSRDQERIMAEARRLRAEAMAMLFRSAAHAVARFARFAAAPVMRWHERQQTLAELSAMSDQQLADIGLSRSDISSVVAGTYRDERGPRTHRKPLPIRLDPGLRSRPTKHAA